MTLPKSCTVMLIEVNWNRNFLQYKLNINFKEARRLGIAVVWRNISRGRTMPSAVFGASPALPQTALPEIESGLKTELLNAGAGASPILLLLICNSVFLTPAPLLVSFSRRATLPLSALHDAKERDGLRALRQASIS